jgi:hypothetical protein
MILKIPLAVDARRGISLSTNAGIPRLPAIREEMDEDSDLTPTITDRHRRISNELDTNTRFGVDDEPSFNNLNPHSMLLMHEVCDPPVLAGLTIRYSMLM